MLINIISFTIFGMDEANQAGTDFGDSTQEKYMLEETTKEKHDILSAPHSETPDKTTPEDVTYMNTQRKEKQAEALSEIHDDDLIKTMRIQGTAHINNPAGILTVGIKSENNTEEIVDCIEPVNKTTYSRFTYDRSLKLNIFHQDRIVKKYCHRRIKRCTSWWRGHSDDSTDCDTYRWIDGDKVEIPLYQSCDSLGWRYYNTSEETVQYEKTECASEYWQIDDPKKLIPRVKNNECSIIETQVLIGRATERHYGVDFTRDMWKQRITVLCPDPLKKQPNPCLDLRKKGCSEISSSKTYGSDGQLSYNKRYRCPVRKESTIDAGTKGIHCIDGGNLVKQYEKHDDITKALTQLSVLSEMQKQVKD